MLLFISWTRLANRGYYYLYIPILHWKTWPQTHEIILYSEKHFDRSILFHSYTLLYPVNSITRLRYVSGNRIWFCSKVKIMGITRQKFTVFCICIDISFLIPYHIVTTASTAKQKTPAGHKTIDMILSVCRYQQWCITSNHGCACACTIRGPFTNMV